MNNSVYNKSRAVPDDVWFYDTDGLISQGRYNKMKKQLNGNKLSRLRVKRELKKEMQIEIL